MPPAAGEGKTLAKIFLSPDPTPFKTYQFASRLCVGDRGNVVDLGVAVNNALQGNSAHWTVWALELSSTIVCFFVLNCIHRLDIVCSQMKHCLHDKMDT